MMEKFSSDHNAAMVIVFMTLVAMSYWATLMWDEAKHQDSVERIVWEKKSDYYKYEIRKLRNKGKAD